MLNGRHPTREPGADSPSVEPGDEAFSGYNPIRYTPCPDEFFDRQLAHMDDDELRVTLYGFRRTFGFKKTDDAISISQYLHGIVTRDGRRLDYGCGLKTPRQVLAGLAKAEARHTIFSAFFCKSCGGRVPDDAMLMEERTQTLVNGERRTYEVRVVPGRCLHCDRRLRGFEEKRYFLNVLDDSGQPSARRATGGGSVRATDGGHGGSIPPTDPPSAPTALQTVGGYRPDSTPTAAATETRNSRSRSSRQETESQETTATWRVEDRLADDVSDARHRETEREIDRVTTTATLWSEVSRRLRDEMTDRNFETWVKPLHPLSWRNAELLIGVRDQAVANYLNLRLRPAIERAAAAVAGVPTRVDVVILPS